jgi:hypothetical protein
MATGLSPREVEAYRKQIRTLTITNTAYLLPSSLGRRWGLSAFLLYPGVYSLPLVGVVDGSRSNFTAKTPRMQRKISKILASFALAVKKPSSSNNTQWGETT